MCGCGVSTFCPGGCECGCSHDDPREQTRQAKRFAFETSRLRESRDVWAGGVFAAVDHLFRDIRYYGPSDDAMSLGRVMGDRETLRVLAQAVHGSDEWPEQA